MENTCFNCDASYGLENMYGYMICEDCKAALRLHTDKTIQRHKANFKPNKNGATYVEDLQYRLDYIEKYYAKSAIKLKYLIDRAEKLD